MASSQFLSNQRQGVIFCIDCLMVTNKPSNVKTRLAACFYVVGRNGFEPLKAQGQQIYSLPRLTASVPTHGAVVGN